MYLMHIFWLGFWVGIFKTDYPLPTPAAIPAIAIATFLSCYATAKVISLVPGSKWIIGAGRGFGFSKSSPAIAS